MNPQDDPLRSFGSVLLTSPTHLATVEAQVRLALAGGPQAAPKRQPPAITKNVGTAALVNVAGFIGPKPSWLSMALGWSDAQSIRAAVDAAAADPAIDVVVLYIDSPGGSVFGIQEAAASIAGAAQVKPVIALADPLAASAAYWLASQATQLYVTPSGEVGSIGIIARHEDYSGANAQAGISVTYLTTSAYKSEFNPDQPLSDAAKAAELGRMQDYHAAFVSAVARGRKVKPATVEAQFGQGRVLGAQAALAAKMVDGIASSVTEALGKANVSRGTRRATLTLPPRLAAARRELRILCADDTSR